MTRVLSELLELHGPTFRRGVEALEQASGHGQTDIRLTADVLHASRRKLKDLGLDPTDTTGPELYAALGARLAADEQRIMGLLRDKYAGQDDVICVAKELATVPVPKKCFGLKASVAKRLLKQHPPKKAMKLLGYRSLDSMLKREQVAVLYAVAALTESAAWQRQLIDSYKKLKAVDFETRDMQIVSPEGERWQKLANTVVATKRHNVLGFRELGAVVLLPLPNEKPRAGSLTSMLLALHTMNEIRAASTFLKLCQVKPMFGTLVQEVARDEPHLTTQVFGRPISWHVIQRYYGRFIDRFRSEVFEPHVQSDDLVWHSIEKILAFIDPRLEFWKHTTHLGMLHDQRPVSFNILDVALSYCNDLPFDKRVLQYGKHALQHELIIRYLKHDAVEESVVQGLQTELVPEVATA